MDVWPGHGSFLCASSDERPLGESLLRGEKGRVRADFRLIANLTLKARLALTLPSLLGEGEELSPLVRWSQSDRSSQHVTDARERLPDCPVPVPGTPFPRYTFA